MDPQPSSSVMNPIGSRSNTRDEEKGERRENSNTKDEEKGERRENSNTRDEEKGERRENSKEEIFGMLVSKIRRFLVSEKWVKIFEVLLIIQVSLLDPLFFFIPVINDRQTCVRLDKKLGTAVMIFRSLIDSFYVIYIIAQLLKHFSVVRHKRKDEYIRSGKILLIDFLAVLPLPQVVILIFIPAMRGSRFLNAMFLLRSVVLCQFVPRSFRAFLFITSGTFGEPAKAIVKFSPFIYLLGIDVIGAFWYFLSVERLVQCWTEACKSTLVGCVNSFYCKDNIEHTSQLKHVCPRDGRKTDFFNFGIFSDALESHVLEIAYFPKKFLFCFRWSLQNLSGFGQNLKTSTYIWENVLAISIIILGMLLFLLLIGNLQAIIESRRKDQREKNRLEAIESIEKWPPLHKLSENLKQDIKKHLKYNWEKYIVDAGMILRELPIDLRRSIECSLGLELLKKVNEFKGIGQKFLDDLSKSIELKLFDEGEDIVLEGETINGVVFILHGNLEARSALNDRKKINVPKDGYLCGGNVTWDFNYRVTETVKALTRVHVLVLPAHKMRYFLDHLPDNLKRSVRHELSFAFPKKVKAFKHVGQDDLNVLSKSIEVKIFNEGEYIMEERKTINDMVFIVQGEACSSFSYRGPLNVLKHGDICGEEVTFGVFNHRQSSKLWGSFVTIKALTKVHALVIPADKIKCFLDQVPEAKRSIRRELCFDFLKKVKAFKHIGQNELDDLSKFIELKMFDKGEYITEEGETINDMVFIKASSSLGDIYPFNDTVLIEYEVAFSSLRDKKPINDPKDGDVYGEEVIWNHFSDSSDQLPRSTMTIKVVTTVYALVLPAERVRDLLCRLPEDCKRGIRLELYN